MTDPERLLDLGRGSCDRRRLRAPMLSLGEGASPTQPGAHGRRPPVRGPRRRRRVALVAPHGVVFEEHGRGARLRALRHRAHGRCHFALRAGGWVLRCVDVDGGPRGTPGDTQLGCRS